MFYCEKCMRLSEEQGKCENCGHKNLTVPKENDFVYLTTKDAIWSATVDDVLKDRGIVYTKRGFLGAGIAVQVGYNLESYDFFVPFSLLDTAQELISQIFSESSEDVEEEQP